MPASSRMSRRYQEGSVRRQNDYEGLFGISKYILIDHVLHSTETRKHLKYGIHDSAVYYCIISELLILLQRV